ncbi:hypothetical protein ACLB2K_016336 [Fragaria x ananassa]
MENVKQGSAVIGLPSKTHVVMDCVNKTNSELSSHQKKIFKVDDHIGVAIAGLTADGCVLSLYMRSECINYNYTYESPLPVGRLVVQLAGEEHVRFRNPNFESIGVVKFYFARAGWLTIALLPTPVAFILLAASSGTMALHASTGLIGLSSGFIFAAAVSITSELFRPNIVGVNHNILITNIPLGSLVYGFLAAIVYDANVSTGHSILTSDTIVCVGRNCYFLTFVW